MHAECTPKVVKLLFHIWYFGMRPQALLTWGRVTDPPGSLKDTGRIPLRLFAFVYLEGNPSSDGSGLAIDEACFAPFTCPSALSAGLPVPAPNSSPAACCCHQHASPWRCWLTVIRVLADPNIFIIRRMEASLSRSFLSCALFFTLINIIRWQRFYKQVRVSPNLVQLPEPTSAGLRSNTVGTSEETLKAHSWSWGSQQNLFCNICFSPWLIFYFMLF